MGQRRLIHVVAGKLVYRDGRNGEKQCRVIRSFFSYLRA